MASEAFPQTSACLQGPETRTLELSLKDKRPLLIPVTAVSLQRRSELRKRTHHQNEFPRPFPWGHRCRVPGNRVLSLSSPPSPRI